MFQDLDDPLPLPDAGPARRQAVVSRGAALRRRRRTGAVGVPLAAAAVAASVAVVSAVGARPPGGDALVAAAPSSPVPSQVPSPVSSPHDPGQMTDPARMECIDSAGDSAGTPDVAFFSLDRPLVPLVHYGLVAGEMPATGAVELRFEATTADGRRSRHLVQRIVDSAVTEQYVLDPGTGARRDVPLDPHPYGDPGDHGVGGGTYPEGSLSGLGDSWTWVASLSVDGTVVDSCDTAEDPRD